MRVLTNHPRTKFVNVLRKNSKSVKILIIIYLTGAQNKHFWVSFVFFVTICTAEIIVMDFADYIYNIFPNTRGPAMRKAPNPQSRRPKRHRQHSKRPQTDKLAMSGAKGLWTASPMAEVSLWAGPYLKNIAPKAQCVVWPPVTWHNVKTFQKNEGLGPSCENV